MIGRNEPGGARAVAVRSGEQSMSRLTWRETIQPGAGALAGASLPGPEAPAQIVTKHVAAPGLGGRRGARIRAVRPSTLVQGDETLFMDTRCGPATPAVLATPRRRRSPSM